MKRKEEDMEGEEGEEAETGEKVGEDRENMKAM